MTSADFLPFVVTTSFIFYFFLLARPLQVLTHSFSPYICPIYCIQFRTAIGLRLVWQPYPCIQPDEISVRQTGDLPPPFFKFHLTMNALGFGCILPAFGRIGDFHTLERALAERTIKPDEPPESVRPIHARPAYWSLHRICNGFSKKIYYSRHLLQYHPLIYFFLRGPAIEIAAGKPVCLIGDDRIPL